MREAQLSCTRVQSAAADTPYEVSSIRMAKRPKKSEDRQQQTLDLAIAAARLAHDSNCEDILVLDLRGRSPITDYYVIATGTSDRQLRSVADDIALHGKKDHDSKVWHIAGYDSAEWVLLDFVDIVVHLFDEEHRKYYELELLWGDAPSVPWER